MSELTDEQRIFAIDLAQLAPSDAAFLRFDPTGRWPAEYAPFTDEELIEGVHVPWPERDMDGFARQMLRLGATVQALLHARDEARPKSHSDRYPIYRYDCAVCGEAEEHANHSHKRAAAGAFHGFRFGEREEVDRG